MASNDPHQIQFLLSDDLRKRIDELVGVRYPTQGAAIADLIQLGIEKTDADDPLSEAEMQRALRFNAAMGKNEPKARTNGHANTAA
ncbi:MAG: hypothetical protein AAGA17_00070 [Actinomycetota bacterium]